MPATTCPNSSERRPGASLTGVGTRRRILIVDDDTSVLGVLSDVFDSVDIDVETCSDPELALERFGEGSFDVVISDERMPKMSGSEMLRRLRSLSPRTPTILLTAYGSSRVLARAYERSGVFSYLAKPFDNRALIGTVLEALKAADAVA